MTIDLSQFIPTFIDESVEGLALMESTLLNLEQGDSEAINSIFRAAHSIKGGAGTFGFNQVTDFTHEVETLLDEMRDGRRVIAQSDINLLLQAVDCIKLLIKSASDGVQCQANEIEQVHNALLVTLNLTEQCSDDSGAVTQAVSHSQQWHITFAPHLSMLQTGNDVLNILYALADLGTLTQVVECKDIPPFNSFHPQECYLSWEITLEYSGDRADICELFEWVEDDCELTIEPVTNVSNTQSQPESSKPEVTTNESVLPASSNQEPSKNSALEGGSIRVGIDKVDTLINRVGELVITQAMLKQVGQQVVISQTEYGDKLLEGLVQLEGQTRDLQEDVMRIRMLPISFVFNRFPRMVYDISAKLGKKIALKLSGEQTELDKTVMEKLGDPLVHLVRNSLDHGIEHPDERLASGKDETGLVHLNAYHQGGYIIIDIVDNGRGLNTQKIKHKALEQGLITSEQSLSDQDIHELIFAPGFSTVDQVSELSGRGVGMDVVRRNIESLGGHVRVSSTAGAGSKFSVSLPLTLAILDGQLIRVAQQTYIVPLIAIIESAQVNRAQIKMMAGNPSVYLFRDEYIPIYSIRQLFSLPNKQHHQDETMVVIVESNGDKYALLVDDLLNQQQVVLKNLEANYMAVEGISGATILGDGSVALIVDIKGINSLKQKMAYNNIAPQRTTEVEGV